MIKVYQLKLIWFLFKNISFINKSKQIKKFSFFVLLPLITTATNILSIEKYFIVHSKMLPLSEKIFSFDCTWCFLINFCGIFSAPRKFPLKKNHIDCWSMDTFGFDYCLKADCKKCTASEQQSKNNISNEMEWLLITWKVSLMKVVIIIVNCCCCCKFLSHLMFLLLLFFHSLSLTSYSSSLCTML